MMFCRHTTTVPRLFRRLFLDCFAGISLPFCRPTVGLCQNVCILPPPKNATWENAPPTGQVAHILAPATGKPLRFC